MLERVICSEFGSSLDDGFAVEYPEMKKSKKSNNGVSAGTVLFLKTSGCGHESFSHVNLN